MLMLPDATEQNDHILGNLAAMLEVVERSGISYSHVTVCPCETLDNC